MWHSLSLYRLLKTFSRAKGEYSPHCRSWIYSIVAEDLVSCPMSDTIGQNFANRVWSRQKLRAHGTCERTLSRRHPFHSLLRLHCADWSTDKFVCHWNLQKEKEMLRHQVSNFRKKGSISTSGQHAWRIGIDINLINLGETWACSFSKNAGVAGLLLVLGFLTLFIDKYYSIGQVEMEVAATAHGLQRFWSSR